MHVLHTINAKFNVQVGYNYNGSGSNTLGSFAQVGGTQATRNQNLDLGLTQNWTPKLRQRLAHKLQPQPHSDSERQFLRQRHRLASGNRGRQPDAIDFGYPGLNFTSFSGFGDPVPSLTRNQTLRFLDTLTLVHKKHTMKFGGEVRRIQLNTDTNPDPRGQFSFTGLLTSELANGAPVAGTGNDLADFLLGDPYSASGRFGITNDYFRSWDFIAFAQDDWRVNSHFTLLYGLRYEAVTPPIEISNQISTIDLDPNIINIAPPCPTCAAQVLPGGTGPSAANIPGARSWRLRKLGAAHRRGMAAPDDQTQDSGARRLLDFLQRSGLQHARAQTTSPTNRRSQLPRLSSQLLPSRSCCRQLCFKFKTATRDAFSTPPP